MATSGHALGWLRRRTRAQPTLVPVFSALGLVHAEHRPIRTDRGSAHVGHAEHSNVAILGVEFLLVIVAEPNDSNSGAVNVKHTSVDPQDEAHITGGKVLRVLAVVV